MRLSCREDMANHTNFPPAEHPLSAFSALSLMRNYNQFLAPPGGSFLPEDQLQNVNLAFPPVIGAFHPYMHYSAQTSPSLSEYKTKHSMIPSVSSCGRRPRGEKKPIPDDQKDDRYYERRKRNNQAAKKSRDARKFREDQIALRATILEHENAVLQAQILTLREETQLLRRYILKEKSEVPDKLILEKMYLEEEKMNFMKKWKSEFDGPN